MASVNKVIIVGNLGRDPEVRYTPNGSAVCNLSIATTRNWKNKESGERQEETEWHRVVLFDRLAEIAGEYLRSGRPVYIEGRLRTRKWTDKDGVEKFTTEIYGEQLQLLGDRGEGRGSDRDDRSTHGGDPQVDRGRPAAPSERPQQRSGYGTPAPSPAPRRAPQPASGTGFDDMDDDIPF